METRISDNLQAFLDMISYSEGTVKYGDKDGYNVIVGGSLFDSYDDHPRKLVHINNRLSSTAAGRYQLLERYYDAYKKSLGLQDFSPASQDAIAIQQIKECKALPDIEAGNFEVAVKLCAHIWASLPGAGYHQRENDMEALKQVFIACGGLPADNDLKA
jgi:muramidase (phage lysozyme)